jgi:hypothetical protein
MSRAAHECKRAADNIEHYSLGYRREKALAEVVQDALAVWGHDAAPASAGKRG